MPAKRMKRVKHNSTAPREKSEILKNYCSSKEFEIIKQWARKGAVFIVLGSEYTNTREFYKGLYQIMYSPSTNGACIYDSHFQYREAHMRPYVTISLNDPVNVSHLIDNIKLLDRYRNKVLYTVDYDKEEQEEVDTKKRVASRLLDILGYEVRLRDTSKAQNARVTRLDKLLTMFSEDKTLFITNLLLNHLLCCTPMRTGKLLTYGDRITGLSLSGLFMEDSYEQITVNGKKFGFWVYKQTGYSELDSAISDMAKRVELHRNEISSYTKELMSTGGTGYRCARMFLYRMVDLTNTVTSADTAEED